jgi:hypothetical protein
MTADIRFPSTVRLIDADHCSFPCPFSTRQKLKRSSVTGSIALKFVSGTSPRRGFPRKVGIPRLLYPAGPRTGRSVSMAILAH